jgi:hypothetical protein
MAASARQALAKRPPGYGTIAQFHLEKALAAHEDAVKAMRYQKAAQAEAVLKEGLMHAFLAYRLSHGRSALSADHGERRVLLPEAEERIAYLGDTLAALKSAIEYSNCTVSATASNQIGEAMRLYNDALGELRGNSPKMARRAAQAGVLQAAFTCELIESENGSVLPQTSGLNNMLAVCPVRKLNQLAAQVVQVHIACPEAESESATPARAKLARAIHSLNGAIRALARDNVVYAQALVVSGLAEVLEARTLIEPPLPGAWWQEERETERYRRKFNADNVEVLVGEIKGMIALSGNRTADRAAVHLDAAVKAYMQAVAALDAGELKQAAAASASAADQAKRAREALFKPDGTLAFKLG